MVDICLQAICGSRFTEEGFRILLEAFLGLRAYKGFRSLWVLRQLEES